MRRRTVYIAVLCLGLASIGCAQGIWITVSNQTPVTLTDVGLKYRKNGNEALAQIGAVRPGESVRASKIFFDAESNLILTFRDAKGVVHNPQVDIYLDVGSHDPVTLRVRNDYTIWCEGRCTNAGSLPPRR
jgi:hypothetical protein